MTKDFLVEMNGRWFRVTRRPQRQKIARNVRVEIAVIAITGLVTEILLPNNSWVIILMIAGIAGVFLYAIYENLKIKRKVKLILVRTIEAFELRLYKSSVSYTVTRCHKTLGRVQFHALFVALPLLIGTIT